MARDRAAARGHRGARLRAGAAASDLSRVRGRSGALGRPAGGRRRSCGTPTRRGSRARSAGRGAPSPRAPPRQRPRPSGAVAGRSRRSGPRRAGRGRRHRTLRSARRRPRRGARRRRRAPAGGLRRRGELRRHAQRQLHERLLLPLRLLRVLEGEAGREPARGKPYVVPLEEIVRRAKEAGTAAPSSSASRAASTPRSPARRTWRSARP